MCWRSKKKPVLQIASEDIAVEKVLLGGEGCLMYSPAYTECCWVSGELKCEELGEVEKEKDCYVVNEGFHSCERITYDGKSGEWMSFSRGEYVPIFMADDGEIVCKAIIPKGAEYYVNEDGEYVSNMLQILWDKEENC